MSQVEYTQPFTSAPRPRRAGKASSEELQAQRLARAFYTRIGAPDRLLNGQDLRTAALLLYRYPYERRRRALAMLLDYYGRASRRRRPRHIGLWLFYCQHLEQITAGERAARRRQRWHRQQAAKRVERARELALEKRRDEAEEAAPLPAHEMDPNAPPEGTSAELWREWVAAMRRLEGRMLPTSFDVWIRSLVPVAREGDVWTIRAPSKVVAEWVGEHYIGDIRRALGNVEVRLRAES